TARYLGLTPAEGRLFQLATGAVSRLGTEHGRPVVAALNVALPESLQPE
ncbi:histidine phosphatase family protein, partial [Streptomyces sp. SID7982]|nr:histidine phosphatase family protein [Streptomyces sp. SID7982]